MGGSSCRHLNSSQLKYIDNRNYSQLGCCSQQEVYNDSLLEVRVTAEESILIHILILQGESLWELGHSRRNFPKCSLLGRFTTGDEIR